jgi:L-threonylcarbamoyladenylate synthase
VQFIPTHWWKLSDQMNVDQLKNTFEVIYAAKLLQEGGLVAFPTETVYGLGADATSSKAVAQIFEAKGRPADNPLIVHFADLSQIKEYVKKIPTVAYTLLRKFSPGPLTLVMEHNGKFASEVTAGLPTVGVRIPNHPVALALLQQCEVPIAAPSANRSGRPSPTEARHVWQDLAGKIHVLLDGGPTGIGVESTVIDVTKEVPVLLRPGGISVEELEQVVGEIEVDSGLTQGKKPRSPGMKYRHYAPKAEMWVVTGSKKAVIARISQLAWEARNKGKKVGILTTAEHQKKYTGMTVIAVGSRFDPSSVARELYSALRRFDEEEVDIIFAEGFPEEGLFFSVMNRLKKAADGKIIKA